MDRETHKLDRQTHMQVHVELHKALDALVADWVAETGLMPSQATVLALMRWSYAQTHNPSDIQNLVSEKS